MSRGDTDGEDDGIVRVSTRWIHVHVKDRRSELGVEREERRGAKKARMWGVELWYNLNDSRCAYGNL